MVGTRPIRLPACLCGRTTARKAATLRTTSIFSISSASGVAFDRAEDVVGPGEFSGADLGRVARRGVLDFAAELGIALDETRLELREETQDVLGHQHLAVTRSRGTDADRGHRHALSDRIAELLHHALDHDREG